MTVSDLINELYYLLRRKLVYVAIRKRYTLSNTDSSDGYYIDKTINHITPKEEFGFGVISYDCGDKNSCITIRVEANDIFITAAFGDNKIVCISNDMENDYQLASLLRTVYDIIFSLSAIDNGLLDSEYFYRMIKYDNLYIENCDYKLSHRAYDYFVKNKVTTKIVSTKDEISLTPTHGGDFSSVIYEDETTGFILETSIRKLKNFSRDVETRCSDMEMMNPSYVSMLSFLAITQLTNKSMNLSYSTTMIEFMYDPIKELVSKFN